MRTRSSVRTSLRRVTLQMALGALAIGPTLAVAQEDSVTVQAGTNYSENGFVRFFLGDRYRELWTAPIEVPVLSPDTFAGGLELLERGGGRQTKSLRFGSKDGREWVFRSIDKDQSGGLPRDFEDTVLDDIIQDQVSSKHPGGALVVDALLETVGVLHASPRLAVMADHPMLGEYRSEFGGMLGIIEERPDESDGAQGSPYKFRGHERVIGSDRFLERLRESSEDRSDARAFLTARLMDLLLGDWDRHEDQWRWAQVDRDGARHWLPIPRDRDNAFFHADGVIRRVGKMMRPFVVTFDENVSDLSGLTYNARLLDQLILPELTREEWQEVAAEVQGHLTDDVIANAVAVLPPAYYEGSGEDLIRKLRARRDRLTEILPAFYDQIVREAAVFATDEDDDLEVVREPGGSVVVRLDDRERGTYFERRFVPAETREVRIFLYDGDDRAIVQGASERGVVIRVIGGDGDDRLEDVTAAGSAPTIFYDSSGDNAFVTGPATTVDRRRYTLAAIDTLLRNNLPPARDWGVARSWFFPSVGWESEIGPVLGVGPMWVRFGFRQDPFATQMHAQLQVAPLEGRFGVKLSGRRRMTGNHAEARLDATATQISVTRFHGFGNDTPAGPNPDRMLVWSNRYGASAELRQFPTDNWQIGVGPAIEFTDPDPQFGSPAADTEPPGSGSFGVAGLQLGTAYDNRNSGSYPRSGVRVAAALAGYPLVWGDTPEGFVRSSATAATYFGVPLPLESTVALRAGGAWVLGDAPFQYAATVGGGSSLRGYRTNRFTGDQSVFGSAELRSLIGRVDLRIARGDIGTILLADLGRVFVSGEDSSTWHTAFGGGLWFGLVDRHLVGHSTIAFGERTTLNLGLGMPF
ncbi:MAG: BamA/TamA family outer membrane protein [Gemmatimonas sp.]|nr:BamA/TamA family outer membrane protein [Gemmatimonas sp.]